jgi:hypothetical protein
MLFFLMASKLHQEEVTTKHKCKPTGYTIIEHGKAITDCGDTIVIKPIRLTTNDTAITTPLERRKVECQIKITREYVENDNKGKKIKGVIAYSKTQLYIRLDNTNYLYKIVYFDRNEWTIFAENDNEKVALVIGKNLVRFNIAPKTNKYRRIEVLFHIDQIKFYEYTHES